MTSQRRRQRRGFTLIELGIVLAVTAILAAAFVPDFVESARTSMAEKAAGDVNGLLDSARWYYVRSLDGSAMTGRRGTWPGQQGPQTCAMQLSPPNSGIQELWLSGYITSIPLNPWGQPYEAQLEYANALAGTGGPPPACNFELDTNLPNDTGLLAAFKSFIPLAQCNNDDPPPPPDRRCQVSTPLPAGFVRCCAFSPKPGVTVSPCQTGKPMLVAGRLECVQ
ncbi:MAG: prepilin-type N-terminal cleavage/methylation domain-containing protein [Myxococcales bacterium]